MPGDLAKDATRVNRHAKGMKQRLLFLWQLLNDTWDEFSKVRGDLLAAALAFHTLLSMAPLIIVAVAIAGIVLGQGTAHAEVTRVLIDALGRKSAATVNEWVTQASEGGKLASAVGITLMLIAASRLGEQLRSALNQIWQIDVLLAEGFRSSVKDYLYRQVFGFALVAAAGPLLLVVFASRTLLTGFHATVFGWSPWEGVIIQVLQLILALAVVACVSAVVFRYVPDTRVGWRNVLVGGALTSILFNLGNLLVSFYLARATVTAAYGAAGSLVVVLLWLYFSAQFFLLGASFTRVYSKHFGHGLGPEESAELERIKAKTGAAQASTPSTGGARSAAASKRAAE